MIIITITMIMIMFFSGIRRIIKAKMISMRLDINVILLFEDYFLFLFPEHSCYFKLLYY